MPSPETLSRIALILAAVAAVVYAVVGLTR
jgi:hypothetical protein